MNKVSAKVVQLRLDEADYLTDNQERCKACGHLEILHCTHCCCFCEVPGCKCEWGKMPDDN